MSDFLLDDIWREEAPLRNRWQIEITKESMDEHHLSCIALFCFVVVPAAAVAVVAVPATAAAAFVVVTGAHSLIP